MSPPFFVPLKPNTASQSAFRLIDLRHARLLASGSERDVYDHPDDANQLIKIVNGARANEAGRRIRWHKQFHRERNHRVFLTELTEYIATTVQCNSLVGNVLLARIAGLVNTTLGLGLAVEKITAAHGELAPTLQHIVKHEGYSAVLRTQVHDFFLALTEAHVIFTDVSARNIVLGCNTDGKQGLFLVDGYGPKQLLPLYAWNKTLNQRRMMRKYRELDAKLTLLGNL